MEFPAYQVPLAGNGMVIGVNAIVHVLLSHGIAIGVLFLVFLGERHQRSLHVGPAAHAWRRYQKKLLRFAAFIVTTTGAITGAGIWFTTMGLAPRGIASMLRIFFWAWFVEWLVFTTEALILLLLYWRWNRLQTAGRYRSTGAYVASGVLSAILITGNLGFMLTPGKWLQDASFWSGFLNPSFAPQVCLRLSIALVVGGIAGMLFALAAAHDARVRSDAVRLAGWTCLGGAAFCSVAAPFYFVSVPQSYLERSLFAVTTSRLSGHPKLFIAANIIAATAVLFAAALAIRRRVAALKWMVGPALVMAIALVAEFERVREFIRGPYLMPGYMYANGVLVAEAGMLERNAAPTPEAATEPVLAGARVFARQCSACHTVGGVNDIRQRVSGRPRDGIQVILDHTHEMVSFMPPLSATGVEKDATAEFLWTLSQEKVRWESRARILPAAGQTKPGAP